MSASSPRSRKRVSLLLPVSIGGLLLILSVAPGCCKRSLRMGGNGAPAVNTNGTERGGDPVTKEVPHSRETLPEIIERERTSPPPARDDRAIRSHKIPRPAVDNDERTE